MSSVDAAAVTDSYFFFSILKTFLGKPLLFVTVNLYNDETNTAGIRPQKIQWIEDGGVLAGKNIVIVDEVDGSFLFCLSIILILMIVFKFQCR